MDRSGASVERVKQLAAPSQPDKLEDPIRRERVEAGDGLEGLCRVGSADRLLEVGEQVGESGGTASGVDESVTRTTVLTPSRASSSDQTVARVRELPTASNNAGIPSKTTVWSALEANGAASTTSTR